MIDPDDLAILGDAECPGCGHIGDHAIGCPAAECCPGCGERLPCNACGAA
jgi:hypothetical protein